MDIIKGTVIVAALVVFSLTTKYAVDNVKLHPTTQADVELAKIKAADAQAQRDASSSNTNDDITRRRLKCILDIKNTVGTDHPQFTDLVSSTCK